MSNLAGNTVSGSKGFGAANYLKITIYGLAVTALWSSLHTIVIQLRLLELVAEAQKNTYLSLLTGTGLILAMVVQPVSGAFSDHYGFRWGRRRPYILLGTILTLFFLPGIGFCGSYLTLFITYCLLQVSSNLAQGPYQAFIPDLVHEGRRGLASGVKSLLELVGGVIVVRLIAYLMDRYFTEPGGPWLGYTLVILGGILLGTMLITILMVNEKPGTGGTRFPLFSTLYRSFRIEGRTKNAFIWFLISRLLILTAFSALQKFALYFLMDVVGVTNPAAVTADLLIVVGVCMLIAVYPAGHLSDRVGRKPIVFSSGLLGAVGIILLSFSHSYLPVMLCGALLGFSFGAFMSTNWALATDLVAKGEEGRYLGLTNLATAGGSALTLFIIGPLIDLLNTYGPGLGYRVMFQFCCLCLVVGSFLVLKIKGQT